MMNAEWGGRLCLAMRENHASEGPGSKPPQCDINATSKRVASQPIATIKPPCYENGRQALRVSFYVIVFVGLARVLGKW